jgi:hypothetical protein
MEVVPTCSWHQFSSRCFCLFCCFFGLVIFPSFGTDYGRRSDGQVILSITTVGQVVVVVCFFFNVLQHGIVVIPRTASGCLFSSTRALRHRSRGFDWTIDCAPVAHILPRGVVCLSSG